MSRAKRTVGASINELLTLKIINPPGDGDAIAGIPRLTYDIDLANPIVSYSSPHYTDSMWSALSKPRRTNRSFPGTTLNTRLNTYMALPPNPYGIQMGRSLVETIATMDRDFGFELPSPVTSGNTWSWNGSFPLMPIWATSSLFKDFEKFMNTLLDSVGRAQNLANEVAEGDFVGIFDALADNIEGVLNDIDGIVGMIGNIRKYLPYRFAGFTFTFVHDSTTHQLFFNYTYKEYAFKLTEEPWPVPKVVDVAVELVRVTIRKVARLFGFIYKLQFGDLIFEMAEELHEVAVWMKEMIEKTSTKNGGKIDWSSQNGNGFLLKTAIQTILFTVGLVGDEIIQLIRDLINPLLQGDTYH